MRQFAIISESIALLSMTKISFYLYVIMYQVMAFDMQWLSNLCYLSYYDMFLYIIILK